MFIFKQGLQVVYQTVMIDHSRSLLEIDWGTQ